MDGKAVLGLSLVISGIVLMFMAGVQAGLILIFPYVMTTGPIGGLGILFLFLGSVLFFLSLFDISPGFRAGYGFGEKVDAGKRGIGIVLLGPIPLIIDTNNKRLSLISVAIFVTAVLVLVIIMLHGI